MTSLGKRVGSTVLKLSTLSDIVHPGAAHTPGDSFVWVPKRNTVFTGDIVFVERILGIGDQSSIAEWPHAFRGPCQRNMA